VSEPRSTYFTSITQVTYGAFNRLNLGVDFWFKSVLADGPGSSNALNVLRFPSTPNFSSKLGYVGPRFKTYIHKKWQGLTYQSSFLIPISQDLENRNRSDQSQFVFVEWDRYLWIQDIFWQRMLSNKWQLFTKTAFWTSVPRDSYRTNWYLETPVAAYVSFFPTRQITLLGTTEFWVKHTRDVPSASGQSNNEFAPFHSFFAHSGIGMKYQIPGTQIELEALYTKFWMGSNFEGAGQTFNAGIRWLYNR